MSEFSANLVLPYLAPGQSQKHVTVNETLTRLDAIVQIGVTSASTLIEPAGPADGALYILPTGKTGAAWGEMGNAMLAYWRDGAWEQIVPREGWLAWVRDANQLLVFDGAGWSQGALRSGLGLGDAALRNVGASGGAVPLLNASCTWSAAQTHTASINLMADWAGLAFGGTGYAVPRYTMRHRGDGSSWEFLQVDPLTSAFVRTAAYHDGGSGEWTFGGPGAFAGSVRPTADNAVATGAPGQRWSVVYSASGTINTSDAREKTALRPIPDPVRRAALRLVGEIGAFQWLNAVAEKSEDAARLHVGLTAQAVRDAFAAEGVQASQWGLFCEDEVDGRSRLGLRFDQLLFLMLAAMAGQPQTEPSLPVDG